MKRFKVDNFSGRMITEGDPTDRPFADASALENLKAKLGMLYLDRDKFCSKAVTSKTLLDGYDSLIAFMSAYPWMAPNGNMVLAHVYRSSGYPTPKLIAWYTSVNPLDTEIASKSIGPYVQDVQRYGNIYIPSRNVLRIGHNSYRYPSTICYIAGGLQSFTDYINGMCVGVFTPQVLGRIQSYEGSLTMVDQTIGQYGARADSLDYGHHNVGFSATLDPTGGKFEDNCVIHYALSFVYDDNQESALEQCSEPINNATYNRVTLRLYIGNSSDSYWQLDPRITHINIYRAVTSSGELSATSRDYMLFLSVPVSGSFSTDKGAVTWATGSGLPYIDAKLNYVDFNDVGKALADSYYNRTGVMEMNTAMNYGNYERKNVVSFAVKWDIGCAVRGRAIVNCLVRRWNNVEEYTTKTLVVSEINQYDVFKPGSEIALAYSDSSEFIAIRPLGYDRCAIFDAHTCYVLNVANDPVNWYVEKILQISIDNADNVADMDNGLAVACRDGCYYINQFGEMQELTISIRAFWRSMDNDDAKPYYDQREKCLYVTTIVDTDENVTGWLFDFNNGQICYLNDHVLGYLETNEAIFKGLDNKILLLRVNIPSGILYIREISDGVISVPFEYVSPALNMDTPNTRKRALFIDVTYLSSSTVTLKVETDDAVNTNTVTCYLSAAAARKTVRCAIPIEFRSMTVTMSGATTGSFELYDYTIEYMEQRF